MNIISHINAFFWDSFLILVMCGTGIYFTLRLRFVQVRKLGKGLRGLFGGLFSRRKKGQNGISSFQSLMTAIAGQVGVGNIAGAATAIVAGGPGAIFWMWVSAFFGMATSYAEATLAQEYKIRRDGVSQGGPVYYILAAFRGRLGKCLAAFFAAAITVALGFMGNMVQVNSTAAAFASAFHMPPLAVGIATALLAAVVFRGGVKRITSLMEKLVPAMALLYITGSLIVILSYRQNIGTAFAQIFVLAFRPTAVIGGVAGTAIQKAIRFGVARGLFSNEAGMGSSPHAHALAEVKHPCEQGIAAMVGIFIDTFVILTLTALVILTSGVLQTNQTGASLAQAAFQSVLGQFGNVFIAISMFCFAFSSVTGWFLFGQINVKYLLGPRAVRIYTLLVLGCIILGSVLQVELVWNLADLANALMILPNLLALLMLSGEVVRLTKDYESLLP